MMFYMILGLVSNPPLGRSSRPASRAASGMFVVGVVPGPTAHVIFGLAISDWLMIVNASASTVPVPTISDVIPAGSWAFWTPCARN